MFQKTLDEQKNNFDLYGLDFFVDGSKRPKRPKVFERDVNAQERLIK